MSDFRLSPSQAKENDMESLLNTFMDQIDKQFSKRSLNMSNKYSDGNKHNF